jgi:hypothetical protein
MEAMGALIGIIALLCGGALLRWASKSRWLLFLAIVLWGGLIRMAYRNAGIEGLIVIGVLTGLVVATAFMLPWLGRSKVVMIAKGAFIILWRRMNGLARVAENAAKVESRGK